jgi:hypothetical protein
MLSEKIQLFNRVTIFITSAMFLQICSTIGPNGFFEVNPFERIDRGKGLPLWPFFPTGRSLQRPNVWCKTAPSALLVDTGAGFSHTAFIDAWPDFLTMVRSQGVAADIPLLEELEQYAIPANAKSPDV